MRAVATLLAVLATASPAAAFSFDGSVRGRLRAPAVLTVRATHVQGTDRSRSCQAGRNHGSRSLIGDRRRPAVVACEQPPRSSTLGGASFAKAAASAIAALG